MIIVVGGIKGGSGKTTVATHLAVMRSAAGADLLLVDADDQETAMDFTQLRTEQLGDAGYTSIKLTGPAVRTQVAKLHEKYDDIVIDTGGRDTASQRAAMSIADLLLVPFVPRSFDIWTIEKVSELVGLLQPVNPNLKAWTFINRADPRGSDNSDAAEALRENPGIDFLEVSIGTRKAFGNAAAQGLTVGELKPPDPKALEEIQALYCRIFDGTLTAECRQDAAAGDAAHVG